VRNRWSDEEAAWLVERLAAGEGGEAERALALRAYSSRLLGAEPELVLHGGGNTSVKGTARDLFGAERPALFVKASGRDLAAARPEDHVAVDLAAARRLLGLPEDLDDRELLRALRACLLDPDAPHPSIETPVHAALPGRYVDHTHADAILALTNRPDGEAVVRAALGDEVAIVPYRSPGLPLAREVAEAVAALPDGAAGAGAMVWLRHGVVTWGETARESYDRMIELVTRAEEHLGAAGTSGPAEVVGRASAHRAGPGGSPRSQRRAAGPRPTLRPAAEPDIRVAPEEGGRWLTRLAPVLRGALSAPTGDPDRPWRRPILRVARDEATLAALATPGFRELADTPPLTADHLIRTGPWPLWLDLDWSDQAAEAAPAPDPEIEGAPPGALLERIAEAAAAWSERYRGYVERHRRRLTAAAAPGEAWSVHDGRGGASGAAGCLPRVVLIPGLGIVAAGATAAEAEVARDVAVHTVAVKARMAAAGAAYEGLSEEHLFEQEHRWLQRVKLGSPPLTPTLSPPGGLGRGRQSTASPPLTPTLSPPGGEERAPPPAPRGDDHPSYSLEGTIGLVTGAAGAIGSGVARVLLEAGGHLVVTDLPGERLDSLAEELTAGFPGRVLAVPVDVTDAGSVAAGFDAAAREWGGVDLVVAGAGAAHVAPLEALDLAAFERLERVNVHGTLLTLAEAARRFRRQGTGGDVVLISTKNVFAPGAAFGAYSATKAAAHQLARVASQELAPLGVRVNMVAPDAVFGDDERRSGLWAEVGPERMRARGLSEAALEAYYRDRNLLKARITAHHVGRAVLFLATRQTPTTGATIPVDGGLPDATPR
jgi:rhamnose utilization protein RhaD (predicted bifunctional aldolase and dehydrogenase)/NAD(P)-dependent dehydrogenase (short-subunit alcohol dehydrogenase family)